MTLDESYETTRHAKPVRCPRCRKASPVLVFDSPIGGMVCPHCHEKLIALRRHASVPACNRGVAAPYTQEKNQLPVHDVERDPGVAVRLSLGGHDLPRVP